MFRKEFWLGDEGAIARAIRTAAQTAIALLGASQFSLFTMDLKNVIGVSGAAALMSVLMSLDRTRPSGFTGSASFQPLPATQAGDVEVVSERIRGFAPMSPSKAKLPTDEIVHGHGGDLR